MSRVRAALSLDLTLQKRYGFYYAAAFVTVVWIVLLRFVPDSWLGMAVPFLVFMDLGVIGFYFLAAQVIYEKTEGTINAIVVTPLRFKEYLVSKLISLTILSWVISMIVAVSGVGLSFNLVLFSLGIIFTSLLILAVGMVAVAPHSSISAFLLPSQLYFFPICIPLIDFFGWIKSPFVYLIPSQASLVLLKGAFYSITTLQLVYAVIYQLVWTVILFIIAEKRYNRYVIAGSAPAERGNAK